MPFLFYAWVSSFAYAFLAIFSKLTSKHVISNPWLLNFSWTFFSFVLLLPILATKDLTWPNEWLFLILASVCNAIWFILYAFSLYKLDVSVISPLYNFQNIFAIALSFIFLNEQISPFQLFLIALIFIAGMFVSLDEKFHIRSFFNKSVGILALGMFFLSLSRIFTNLTLRENGIWETTAGIFTFTLLALIPTFPLFKKDLKRLTVKQASPLLLMSISYVIGTVAAYEAFKENVGISSIIISLPLSLILIIILSRYKPDLLEKHTAKVYTIRFIATLIMIVSALML